MPHLVSEKTYTNLKEIKNGAYKLFKLKPRVVAPRNSTVDFKMVLYHISQSSTMDHNLLVTKNYIISSQINLLLYPWNDHFFLTYPIIINVNHLKKTITLLRKTKVLQTCLNWLLLYLPWVSWKHRPPEKIPNISSLNITFFMEQKKLKAQGQVNLVKQSQLRFYFKLC